MNSLNPNSVEYHRAYKRAEQRVQAKIGFQWHLVSYLLGIVLLVAIYLVTTRLPGFTAYPWFIWPLAGWGFALLLHFLQVFVFNESRAEVKRRRMLDSELRRNMK
jgi:hypothetical protein